MLAERGSQRPAGRDGRAPVWSIKIDREYLRRSAIPSAVRMSRVVPGSVELLELEAAGSHRRAAPHPVLLVNGLGSSASGWLAMIAALQRHGVTVAAVSYPVFGTSVERLAEGVAEAVGTLLDQTGAAKVHLVGHSLGGVVVAHALAGGRMAGNVDAVVTIGAPFGGSPWANLLPVSVTVRSLRPGSPQL